MKVQRKVAGEAAAKPRAEDFRRLLDAALRTSKKKPLPRLTVAQLADVRALTLVHARAKTVLETVERLGTARESMHEDVERLDASAAHTQVQRREAERERRGALEVREEQRRVLQGEREQPEFRPWKSDRPENATARGPSGIDVSAPGARGVAERFRAEASTEPVALTSALELVERIEAFVRAQRPGLALTLKGALQGRLEIEKTGPNEVSVLLETATGQLPLSQMAQVRDVLIARGLKVRQLRVV